MPLLSKLLPGLTHAFNVTTDVPVTGVGGLPKAIICYGARVNADDTRFTQFSTSFGWAVDTTHRGFISIGAQHNINPTLIKATIRDNGFFGYYGGTLAGGIDGVSDLTSMDADGFTHHARSGLVYNLAGLKFNAMCLGGSVITNVICGSDAMPTGAGNFSITGLGFRPDCILIAATGRSQTTINVDGEATGFSVGFGTALAQRCLSMNHQTAVTPSNGRTMVSVNKILACCLPDSNASLDVSCTLVSLDADGFTLNKVNGGTGVATRFIWLALKGGSYKIVDMAAAIATGLNSFGSAGFIPKGFICLARPGVTAGQSLPTDEVEYSIGGATGPAERASIWALDMQAQAASNCADVQTPTGIYLNWKFVPSVFSQDGKVDLDSVDANGFTLNTVDADPSATLIPSLWFGEEGTPFYLINTVSSDAAHGQMQMGGVAPALLTTGTGWTVATTPSGNYSRMAFGVERIAGTFSGTAQPSSGPDNALGDCYKTTTRLTGTFAAGDWNFSVLVRAVTSAGGQDGRFRVRVWKGTNADGSGATEITSGAVVLSTVTDLLTSVDQTSLGALTLGEISLNNEFLFIQLAWEITGAAS